MRPVAREEGGEEREGVGVEPRGSGRCGGIRDHAAELHDERRVRAGAPVTAQSWKLGAQPAIDRLRRRYESSVRLAPCSRRLSDRRAPTRSRYCWSEPSSSVTRSAVSTIALAAV
ncbi:hypothetical protein MAFF212519_13120 [Clavibacter michiganensis]